MNHKGSFLRSVLNAFSIRTLSIVVVFFNSTLLARMLGAEDYGSYSLCMAATTLSSTVSSLGLPTYTTRQIAINRARNQQEKSFNLIYFAVKCVLASSFIVTLTGALFLNNTSYTNSLNMYGWGALLSLIPIATLTQIIASFFRGNGSHMIADLADTGIRPLLVSLLLIISYVAATEINQQNATLIQAISAIIALLLGSYSYIKNKSHQPSPSTKYNDTRNKLACLQESSIFLLINIVSLLEVQAPIYLLGDIVDSKEAGVYQLANQFAAGITIGIISCNNTLQPKIASTWANREIENAQSITTHSAKLCLLIATISCILLLLLGPQLISFFGDSYRDAEKPLRFLALAQFYNALTGPCGLILGMTGHQQDILKTRSISLLITFVSALYLVPNLRAEGAAISTLVGALFFNTRLTWLTLKKTRIYSPPLGIFAYKAIKDVFN